MRIRTYLYVLFWGVVGLVLISSTCHAAETKTELTKDWGLRISYDLKGSYWFSSDDDDDEGGVGHALDFKPELIPTYAVRGEIMWRNAKFYKLYYETSATESKTDQEELLEISEKKSTINKINTYLDFFPFIKESNSAILNFLSHLRFDYKKHLFLGEAEVQEPTQYIASDSTIISLNPGDEIRFKSDFEEISLTWRISDFCHLGVYRAKTLKPHESSILAPVNTVFETEITGTGFKCILESDTSMFDMNLGAVKFRGDQGNFKSDGFELMIHGEWRPHFYLFGNAESPSRSSLAIVPSLGGQFSMQFGDEAEGYESDGTGELSMDIIVDASIGIIYQF
jgi:hypothetical protein